MRSCHPRLSPRRTFLQYAENETVIFSDTGEPGAVTNMFFGGQFDLPGAKTGGVGYRECHTIGLSTAR